MIKKQLFIISLLSFLLGCSSKETINPQKSTHYVVDTKTNEVFYKSVPNGIGFGYNYKKLATDNPSKLKILGINYATDGKHVFYCGSIIQDAQANGFNAYGEYSDCFATNSITQKLYYRDTVLPIDVSSAKILSRRYVLEKNNVLFRDKQYFNIEVPAQDIASFAIDTTTKSHNASTLAKDKFYYYLNSVRIPVASQSAQIIQLGLPSVFLDKDTLHYIFPSYRNFDHFQKKLDAKFKAINKGIIGKTTYDEYYHYKVNGLQNAQQISKSKWIKDNNGLYFLGIDNAVTQMESQSSDSYVYNNDYPEYMRTENTLFAVYFNKTSLFSTSAEIISKKVVKDKNHIYYEGVEVANVDAATFIALEYNFLDKNYYYYNIHPNKNRHPIPEWAYEELKNGRIKWREFSNVALQHSQTIYTKYWNGFLVTMKVPTAQNTNKTMSITLKNIARKPLTLAHPLEELLFLTIKEYEKEAPFTLLQLHSNTSYNFKNIAPDDTIELTANITPDSIDVDTYKSKKYILLLSSTNPPNIDNYDALYLKTEVDF